MAAAFPPPGASDDRAKGLPARALGRYRRLPLWAKIGLPIGTLLGLGAIGSALDEDPVEVATTDATSTTVDTRPATTSPAPATTTTVVPTTTTTTTAAVAPPPTEPAVTEPPTTPAPPPPTDPVPVTEAAPPPTEPPAPPPAPIAELPVATDPAPAEAPAPSGDREGCDPAYPTVCIPSPPPDLDCGDITFRRFEVLPPDPHSFDNDDEDVIGCESD